MGRMMGTGNSKDFNPRPPCGGRLTIPVRCFLLEHISIHAPRAGGDGIGAEIVLGAGISIHAPRAGGDDVAIIRDVVADISIHAPRAGGDEKSVFRSAML